MQSVNDDMDELFKNAAQNYPLNTNSADWDKVMQQLHPAGEDVPVTPKKNDRKKYLWLLLLIPFVFICNRYTGTNKEVLNKQNNLPQQRVTNEKIADERSDNDIINKESRKPVNTISIQKNKTDIVQKNTAYRSNNIHLIENNSEVYTKKNIGVNNKNGHNDINDIKERKNNIVSDRSNGIEANNKQNNTSASSGNILNNQPDIALENKPNATPNISSNNNQQPIPNITTDAANQTAIAQGNINNDSSATAAAKPVTKTKSNKKGFYAGIAFGPDYSTIKMQQINKSGYSAGLLAGYQINNRWAVEVGGLWDKKNYYTQGQYFNTQKMPLPYNVKIIHATGTCYMVEIPLNVKYQLTTRTKGNWFVLAGTSSYLMKKEDYTYLYDHNGSIYDVYKVYNNSSRNWFSIMNISAGYERTFRNIATFRIEPYVKLPFSGVGIGHLPITSTGLYITVTRPVGK